MKLNEKKTKTMIFNFSKKYQFTTQLHVNNSNLDMVSETKLLGTVLTDRLTWDRNTEELVKKSYKRMQLLNAAAGFTSAKNDLKRHLSNLYKKCHRAVSCCLAQQPDSEK